MNMPVMQIGKESECYPAAIVAPPPSPIPTGKGSRSAANDSFIKYLVKSSHVPELTLPETHRSYFPSTDIHQQPITIDYRLLTAYYHDSIQRLTKSAKEYGAFLITGHKISVEEARSRQSLQEAEFDREIPRGYQIDRREMSRGNFRESTIIWRRELTETGEGFGRLSKNIEDVSYELDRIAKEVIRGLSRARGGEKLLSVELEMEATVRIYRYVRGDQSELRKNMQKDEDADSAFILRVMFPIETLPESAHWSEGEGGPIAVHWRVDPVVVTCGRQLEEWSHGELKSACSPEPDFQIGISGLLIEYECFLTRSPPPPPTPRGNDQWTLSLAHQVLIVLVVSFLLKFLAEVWSP
ncbi:hypothetical protein SAY87_009211 [Trapa incisa]|uniref:Uncharacterized protein n=1 Tax=Trapa incisa TaxID=236973 RepID=A0AAN7JXZ0_9MYRT|nr:hypothetical protein SAY87_009211 [Trapa incisa]